MSAARVWWQIDLTLVPTVELFTGLSRAGALARRTIRIDAGWMLGVSGRDTPALLDLVEELFDEVACAVRTWIQSANQAGNLVWMNLSDGVP